jgi:hypothetical protein
MSELIEMTPVAPKLFATFSDDGLSAGFYRTDFHADIPAGAVEITEKAWTDWLEHQGERRWDGKAVVKYKRPEVDPQPVAISASVLFGERMTDKEYDALIASIGEAGARTLHAFNATARFDEGTPMFDLLVEHVGKTVSAKRAAKLLASG